MASKAELAKEIAKRKREFYSKVLSIVFDVANETMMNTRSKLDFKVNFTGSNRYIHFSVYGFKMNILLYTRGQLVIQLEEAFHSPFEQQIYEYIDSLDDQEAFLIRFKNMMNFMIPLFTSDGMVDPHTFMDYVEDDLEEACRNVMEDWEMCEKED